jgi:hypothetical protein
MPAFTFDDPQFDLVNVMAVDLWSDFLSALDQESQSLGLPIPSEYDIAQDILEPPTDRPSYFAIRFADHCLLDRPKHSPLLANFDYRWESAANKFAGPSWLFQSRVGELTVVFNTELRKMIRSDTLCRKTVTALYLHEVGHVLINWGSLRPINVPDFIRESSPHQEMLAWWFCMKIVQINVGAYAKGQRQTSHFDFAGLALFGS